MKLSRREAELLAVLERHRGRLLHAEQLRLMLPNPPHVSRVGACLQNLAFKLSREPGPRLRSQKGVGGGYMLEGQ